MALAALFSSSGLDIKPVGWGAEALRMSAVRNALLLCGLVVAVALTLAWDSFLSYEFFKFAEFIF